MRNKQPRFGVTLTELLAVTTLIGVVSLVMIPRIAGRNDDAKVGACDLNQAEIELQAQLWRRATGSFPSTNLTTISGDASYFPDGLPTCPVDGSPYTIDTATGQVLGHSH